MYMNEKMVWNHNYKAYKLILDAQCKIVYGQSIIIEIETESRDKKQKIHIDQRNGFLVKNILFGEIIISNRDRWLLYYSSNI